MWLEVRFHKRLVGMMGGVYASLIEHRFYPRTNLLINYPGRFAGERTHLIRYA